MSEWISAKDRLPRPSKIIYYMVYECVFRCIYIVWYSECDTWILRDTTTPYFDTKNVTHWQPLPEPPKDKIL